MYLCCLSSNFDLFNKHGDYYSIKTCGTGSGFCSGNIYLFKEVEPQAESIPKSAWSTMCAFQAEGVTAIACSLTSVIDIRSDTVTMHYKLEQFELEEAEESKNEKYNVINTEFFDIEYVKRETGWIALDTTNLSKIPQ